MKKFLAILLALAMVFSFAACGEKKTEEPVDNTPKVLKAAQKGDSTGLVPQLVTFTSNQTPFITVLYDRLVDYDADNSTVVPMLAKSWEVIDATHIRFTLRDDVYSHAGDKFTASDVLFTLKLGQESGVVANYYGNWNLDECKVEDDTHVIVATKKADPFALFTLSNIPLAMIVEKSYTEGGGAEAQTLHSTCGTGPYKVVEWSKDAYVKYVKNENYWGDAPYFDEYEISVVKDENARVLALESGDIDICFWPSTTSLDAKKNDPNYTVIDNATTQITTMFFNTRVAPFDDENFRRAVASAINYDAIVKVGLTGHGAVVDSYLPKTSTRYSDPAKTGYTTYNKFDQAKAKELLAASKYANAASFTLIYAESPVFNAVATLMQQQLAEVGIEMKIEKIETAKFRQVIAAEGKTADGKEASFPENPGLGEFQAQMINASNPDPAVQTKYYDPSISFPTVQGGSGWVYGPAEIKDLAAQAYQETDEAKSQALYDQLAKLIVEGAPAVWLYNPTQTCLTKSDIKGVSLTEFGDIDASKVYK